MLDELQPWLTPWARWLIQVAEYYGLNPRVTSTRRTRQQQEVLYARYLRGLTDYPVAPPGQSWHEYGRAFDITSRDNAFLGSVWRSVGGSWWASDAVHFQA